jgi:hypothetical protein
MDRIDRMATLVSSTCVSGCVKRSIKQHPLTQVLLTYPVYPVYPV